MPVEKIRFDKRCGGSKPTVIATEVPEEYNGILRYFDQAVYQDGEISASRDRAMYFEKSGKIVWTPNVISPARWEGKNAYARVTAEWWYAHKRGGRHWSEATKWYDVPTLRPVLEVADLDYSEHPCVNRRTEIVATVRETAGNCSTKFYLKWLGNKTDTKSISAGGTERVSLPYTPTYEYHYPLDIKVSLFGPRDNLIDSRTATVRAIAPMVDINLNAPSNACLGTGVSGSFVTRAVNCPQRLKGSVIDTHSGETLASFGPKDFSPGQRERTGFSFPMPERRVPLKATVQRRLSAGNWATVEKETREIGFKPVRTSVGEVSV